MKIVRTICVVLGLLMLTGSPALAERGPDGRTDGPATKTLHIAFGDVEKAERIVDALNVLLDARGDRQDIEVIFGGNVIEVAGSAHLVDSVAALVNPGDRSGPQAERRRVEREERRAERQQERQARQERQPRQPERSPELEVRVFELSFADASTMVRFVDMLRMGGRLPWAVDCDPRTNTIITKGSPEMVNEAAELISRLDRPAYDDGNNEVMKLMPLSHGEAEVLAKVVSRAGRRSFGDVIVVPDVGTNTIVLAGPQGQVQEASLLIKKLDTDPKQENAQKKDQGKKGDADKAVSNQQAKGKPKNKKQAKDKPAHPKQPAKPGKPAKPDKPAAPDEPAKQAKPNKPAEQAKPKAEQTPPADV